MSSKCIMQRIVWVVLIRITPLPLSLLLANGHSCLSLSRVCGRKAEDFQQRLQGAGRSKRVSVGSELWNSQRDSRAWVLSSCSLTLILNPSSSWSKCGPVDPEKTPYSPRKMLSQARIERENCKRIGSKTAYRDSSRNNRVQLRTLFTSPFHWQKSGCDQCFILN